MKSIDFSRIFPIQKRAFETRDAILDAVIHFFQSERTNRFTTAHISRVSGFSIGTIYRYFRNSDEIIVALFERELEKTRAEVRQALAEIQDLDAEAAVRTFVEIAINRFGRSNWGRRTLVLLLAKKFDPSKMVARIGALADEVFSEIKWREDAIHITPARFFVVRCALLGAIRVILVERPDSLSNKETVDELVSMVVHALQAPELISGIGVRMMDRPSSFVGD